MSEVDTPDLYCNCQASGHCRISLISIHCLSRMIGTRKLGFELPHNISVSDSVIVRSGLAMEVSMIVLYTYSTA